MPSVSLLGSYCTGHGAWPSRPSISGSSNVFFNGKPVNRLGDKWAVHCAKSCHDGILISGSSSVFVNGLPIGRIGDFIDCGSKVADGSLNVFAGG